MASQLQNEPHSNRIGILFEQAFSCYLSHEPLALTRAICRFDQIQSRIQVQSKTTGKTIGEFDFLFIDTLEKRPVHAELAVKFFLLKRPAMSNPEVMANWIGPNQRDRLDLKYEKLFIQQLQLATTPEGRQKVEQLSFEAARIQQQYHVKGVLFYPIEKAGTEINQLRSTLPNTINPQCSLGFWLEMDQAPAFFAGKAHWRWRLLRRREWIYQWETASLATGAAADYSPQTLSTGALEQALHQQLLQFKTPVQIVGFAKEDGYEAQRYFVAPTGWSETT